MTGDGCMATDKESKKNRWGVSRVDRHYFFNTDNTGDSPLLQKVRDTWEALRRCEDYFKLCEGVEFHKSGIVSMKWLAQNREKNDEINKRLNQVGIKQLLDSNKSFFDLQPDIAFDIIGSTPVEVIAPKNLPANFEDKKSNELRFLEDGKYLTVKIDVTQRKGDIENQIKLYLDYYRELIDLPDTRHSGKQQHWQVYDLLKEGNTHTEIIKILWPDEYQKGNDSGESKLQAKYYELRYRYEKQGFKDWEERAWEETYEKNQGGNFKLYVRVRYNKIKAEKEIEEFGLRFKRTT
jgi:hypothetical protein